MPANLLLDQRSGCVIITINRSDTFNTLSIDTLHELTDFMISIGNREDIAALIIKGANGSFAAGADIKELSVLSPHSAIEFSKRGQDLFAIVENLPQLVIAAIDGYCLGGGLDLALACDIRYATSRSTFAHPGARLGIITGFGGTIRLPGVVGRSAALRIFATAERIDATEAERIGLVQQVIEGDVLGLSTSLAEQAVVTGAKNIGHFKSIIKHTGRLTLSQAGLVEKRATELFNQSSEYKKF